MKQKNDYEQVAIAVIAFSSECILTFSTDMKPEGDYDDGNDWNE